MNKRRSNRIPNFDYTSDGFYFATLCTKNRECLFGDVMNGVVELNSFGQIARKCWLEIPVHFKNISLDEYVVMPNHIHGIIAIDSRGRGTACRAPASREHFGKPVRGSIPTIIRSFKSVVTKKINDLREKRPRISVWQKNYHERILQNESDLQKTRNYIKDNPKNWYKDEFNES